MSQPTLQPTDDAYNDPRLATDRPIRWTTSDLELLPESSNRYDAR